MGTYGDTLVPNPKFTDMPNIMKDFPTDARLLVLMKQAEIKASNKRANSSIKDAIVEIVREWKKIKSKSV